MAMLQIWLFSETVEQANTCALFALDIFVQGRSSLMKDVDSHLPQRARD